MTEARKTGKKKKAQSPSYDKIIVGGYIQKKNVDWHDAPNKNEILFPRVFISCRMWGSHEVHHFRYPLLAVELIQKGSVVFSSDAGKTTVKAGELFIIPRGQNTSFTTGPDDFYEKVSICFSGMLLDTLLETLHLGNVVKITLFDPEDMQKRFFEIRDLLDRKTPGTENLLTEKGIGLFLAIRDENKQDTFRNYPDPMRRAMDLLQGNYMHGNISLQLLADHAGVSIPELMYLFRKYSGKTPMKHITELRMVLAKNLLESSSLSIKEIAERSGYNNPLYFSSAFRKYTGIGPRDFRNQARSAEFEPKNQ